MTAATGRLAAVTEWPARPWLLAALAAAAAGLALLVRLALARQGFDVFGDEAIYTDLGHSAASGGLPSIQGNPFFLHPPGYFYLEAGWEKLFGYHTDPIAAIIEMRTLNAALAAVTAAVVVVLAARAACTLLAGGAAGLLFALDPFCVRQNDRVMVETAMMLWVMLGYLALAPLIGRAVSRRTVAGAAGAGAVFGLAVLTKDVAALITVLPLLAAASLRWGPRRPLILTTLTAAVAVYGAYLAVVASLGQIGALWQAKTSGVQRLLGIIQATGFHRPGAPPLVARLAALAGDFGATYALIAIALPALVLVMRRGGPLARVLGLLHASAVVTLGYALAQGTLEEQEFYLVIVPSLLALPLAVTIWIRLACGRSRARRGAAAGVAVTLVIGVSLVAVVQWLATPDTGYARLRQYLIAHVPAGAAITAADGSSERGTSAWVLGDRYRIGRWVWPRVRARNRAGYMIVPWGVVRQHYSYLTPSQARAIVSQGRLVFSVTGRSYGQLTLYRMPLPGARHAR